MNSCACPVVIIEHATEPSDAYGAEFRFGLFPILADLEKALEAT